MSLGEVENISKHKYMEFKEFMSVTDLRIEDQFLQVQVLGPLLQDPTA